MPGFPVLHQFPDFNQAHFHSINNANQPTHPVLPFSTCLQSFPALESFPMIHLFTSGGQSVGASAVDTPSNDYSAMISFRIDWFDLLAIQSTLKSLLQHHTLKPSILQCTAFFKVQFSQLFL